MRCLIGPKQSLLMSTPMPRMKSATQDRYWPDRLGSQTGGSGATVHNGLEKIWVATSVWPMAILVCSVWRIPIFRSGQYPYFGLFGLASTHILACSVWPIPIFRSVRSGQCPYFGLANTKISACWVWPIPKFRSGQYPYFDLFGLANTHISVCSVWPIPIFLSVRSGQHPYFGLFGLAIT